MVNYASAFLIFMLGAILGIPSHADTGTGLSAQEFRLDSEGQVVVIDPNGAELYLDYIGDPRPVSEKIKITINDPGIKIMSGSQCAIKNPSRDCKIVLRYKNIKNPSHGQKTLSVLDGKDSLIKEYVIWVKPNLSEKPIAWFGVKCTAVGPVIVQNATSLTGSYRWINRHRFGDERYISNVFNIPEKSMCFIDKKLILEGVREGGDCSSGRWPYPNFS